MKKTIAERMVIAEGRIAAIRRVYELIQEAKEHDFYTANPVTQAKIETYLDMINTLLDCRLGVSDGTPNYN